MSFLKSLSSSSNSKLFVCSEHLKICPSSLHTFNLFPNCGYNSQLQTLNLISKQSALKRKIQRDYTQLLILIIMNSRSDFVMSASCKGVLMKNLQSMYATKSCHLTYGYRSFLQCGSFHGRGCATTPLISKILTPTFILRSCSYRMRFD